MKFDSKRTLAALLVTVTLAAPGLATAAPGPESPTQAAPGMATGMDDGGKPTAPALAEVKVSREEAIAKAQAMFGIPTDLGAPSYSLGQSLDGAGWSFTWQSANESGPRLTVSATVDAVTGDFLNYNRYNPDQKVTDLALTRQDAAAKATQWLMKLAPSLQSSLRLVDTPQDNWGQLSSQFTFRWERVEQGYPIGYDGVSISINGKTGDLEAYSRQWQTSVTYSLPSKILGQEEAARLYMEQLPMLMQYQRFTQPGTDKVEWRLTYRAQPNMTPMLDQAGILIGPDGSAMDLSIYSKSRIVPVPVIPYQKPAKPLTEQEALALAQRVSGRTDVPTSKGQAGKDQDTQSWEFSWYDKAGGASANVNINAATGVISNYSFWTATTPLKEGEEPKVTEDQAWQKAIDFIITFRPDLAGNVTTLPGDNEIMWKYKMGNVKPPSYYLRFGYLKNDTLVSDATISVEIDANTGAIRSFYSSDTSFKDAEFPAVDGVIDQAKAKAAWIDYQTLTASWVTTYTPADPDKKGSVPEQKTMLAWVPGRNKAPATIDARSGRPLDYQGRDLVEAAKRPEDIAGHWAQREIELLWQRGIFDLKDGKFMPANAISAAEAVRWLVLIRGIHPFMAYDFAKNLAPMGARATEAAQVLTKSEAAPYFGAALDSGILVPEDFLNGMDPNAPVDREVFALWAVRSLGYGEIAKMENRIDMRFADKDAVDAKYANAVAILNGLGIVKGGGESKFNPKAKITRGEAAKILFAVGSTATYTSPYGK